MTRRVLDVLGELRGDLASQVLAASALVALLLPLAAIYDLGAGLAWWVRHRRVARLREVPCPCGKHAVELVGLFECGTCHLNFSGHAFASACPHCSAMQHSVQAVCGHHLINPLSPVGT